MHINVECIRIYYSLVWSCYPLKPSHIKQESSRTIQYKKVSQFVLHLSGKLEFTKLPTVFVRMPFYTNILKVNQSIKQSATATATATEYLFLYPYTMYVYDNKRSSHLLFLSSSLLILLVSMWTSVFMISFDSQRIFQSTANHYENTTGVDLTFYWWYSNRKREKFPENLE